MRISDWSSDVCSSDHLIAVRVTAGVGDYRSGDEIWCERLMPAAFSGALNRDVLLPRPAGRFLFGRLVGREDGKLHILPLGTGMRQQVIADTAWMGVAGKLVRILGGDGRSGGLGMVVVGQDGRGWRERRKK